MLLLFMVAASVFSAYLSEYLHSHRVRLRDRALVQELAIFGANPRYAYSTDGRLYYLEFGPGKQQLTDDGMADVVKLDALTGVDLSQTDVTDDGIQQLHVLAALNFLRVDPRKISISAVDGFKQRFPDAQVYPEYGLRTKAQIISLRQLNLSYHEEESLLKGYFWGPRNRLRSSILPLLSPFNCRTLILRGSRVTDEDLLHISNQQTLRILDLSETKLTDNCIANLILLDQLRSLNLYETRISWEGVQRLQELLPKCRVCWIAGEFRDGTLATGSDLLLPSYDGGSFYSSFGHWTWLERDDLVSLQVSDAQLPMWSLPRLCNSFPDLEELELHRTPTSFYRCKPLLKLQKLKRLSLNGCNIHDEDVRTIAKLPALEFLDLRSTRITAAGIEYLATMSTLKHIDLSNTSFSAVDIDQLRESLPECIVTFE